MSYNSLFLIVEEKLKKVFMYHFLPFSASTSVLDNPRRKIFLCLADESYLPLSDKLGEVKV